MKTELYFGMSRPDGQVTETEWQEFLDAYVTPRFEEGLTVVDASGQYWSRRGDFVRERTKIILLLYPFSPATEASIEYIRSAYRRSFDQESVLRVDYPVDVSFKEQVREGQIRRLGTLEEREINESSGLAHSLRQRGILWTHNDSGDRPRIFAFGLRGEDRGTIELADAQALDWEDMCAVEIEREPYLLVADVGDNERVRDVYTLYLVEEPPLPGAGRTVQATSVQRVNFTYEDGPHNCESVAMDGEEGAVYLVSKNWGWSCGLYRLEWPETDDAGSVEARRIGTVNLPMTTAMDFSPDGISAVVLTYGDAYVYERGADETWADAFRREPRMVPMPKREQGESICYGPDGLRFYLTSEKLPAPLWEVIAPGE